MILAVVSRVWPTCQGFATLMRGNKFDRRIRFKPCTPCITGYKIRRQKYHSVKTRMPTFICMRFSFWWTLIATHLYQFLIADAWNRFTPSLYLRLLQIKLLNQSEQFIGLQESSLLRITWLSKPFSTTHPDRDPSATGWRVLCVRIDGIQESRISGNNRQIHSNIFCWMANRPEVYLEFRF